MRLERNRMELEKSISADRRAVWKRGLLMLLFVLLVGIGAPSGAMPQPREAGHKHCNLSGNTLISFSTAPGSSLFAMTLKTTRTA